MRNLNKSWRHFFLILFFYIVGTNRDALIIVTLISSKKTPKNLNPLHRLETYKRTKSCAIKIQVLDDGKETFLKYWDSWIVNTNLFVLWCCYCSNKWQADTCERWKKFQLDKFSLTGLLCQMWGNNCVAVYPLFIVYPIL